MTDLLERVCVIHRYGFQDEGIAAWVLPAVSATVNKTLGLVGVDNLYCAVRLLAYTRAGHSLVLLCDTITSMHTHIS
jgi:hypothetical protein